MKINKIMMKMKTHNWEGKWILKAKQCFANVKFISSILEGWQGHIDLVPGTKEEVKDTPALLKGTFLLTASWTSLVLEIQIFQKEHWILIQTLQRKFKKKICSNQTWEIKFNTVHIPHILNILKVVPWYNNESHKKVLQN